MANIQLKIGAHVSASGGYRNALANIRKIGGNCLQMFSASSRTWNLPKPDPQYVDIFRKQTLAENISPIYFHSPYLINLASEEITGERSENFIINEMNVAGLIGIKGSIIHLGSYLKSDGDLKKKQRSLMVSRIKNILDHTHTDSRFIVENSGTRKIGQTLEEISEIVKKVSNPRFKICLDTCHLHSAGYNLSEKASFDEFLQKFDQLIGLQNLELIHANDSRDEFGSLRDRHENIGDGKIGKQVFANLLNDARTSQLPYILEVPGIDGMGPDAENINRLKSMSNA